MFSNRFVAASLAAVASFSLVAGVAHAKESSPDTAKVAADAPEKADADVATRKVRYCIKIAPTTGTILTRQQCMTRADWLREGVDPLKLTH